MFMGNIWISLFPEGLHVFPLHFLHQSFKLHVSYSNSLEEDIPYTLRVFFKLGTIFFIDNHYTCRTLKNYNYKKVESLSLFSRWVPVILSNCSFF